jgi:hypothetical protein
MADPPPAPPATPATPSQRPAPPQAPATPQPGLGRRRSSGILSLFTPNERRRSSVDEGDDESESCATLGAGEAHGRHPQVSLA